MRVSRARRAGAGARSEALLETEVHIGDELRIGSVMLERTQPRTPCFKLEVRFQRPAIVRELLDSRRSGFYCSVVSEGEVRAGEPSHGPQGSAMATIVELIKRAKVGSH